jgi:acyl-coenzyme A thioesterase PaaI-like protein
MTSSDDAVADIDPTIGAMLRSATDFLAHEHSLFRSLELKPLLIGRGKAAFSVALPEAFAGGDGAIHGGLYTIILDSIFGMTVFTAIETVMPIATINLRTDYIGAIAPGARAVCAAECEAIRDDVAFVKGRLTAESGGALLATGSATFMIGAKGPMMGIRL